MVAIALVRGFAERCAWWHRQFPGSIRPAPCSVLLPLFSIVSHRPGRYGRAPDPGPHDDRDHLGGARQAITLRAVASQESIKLLSDDNDAFFNANSAHPFENPTALANLKTEMVLIMVIGAADQHGHAVGSPSVQGWALLVAMGVLFVVGVALIYGFEAGGAPALKPRRRREGEPGENKEVRFGAARIQPVRRGRPHRPVARSIPCTTATCRSGGLVLMANLKIGEVDIGAPGSGLFSILLFAILAVFIMGLMVGRTPEYPGQEDRDARNPGDRLGHPRRAGRQPRPGSRDRRGLAARPRRSPGQRPARPFGDALRLHLGRRDQRQRRFAGLSANTPFYNTLLAIGMGIGRFAVILPVLAIAGSLAAKPRSQPSPGTMPTDNALFVGLLIGVILIVGGLIYFPALTLAPILEQVSI